LAEAKEFSIDIEENLLDSKIEPFQYPRTKTEARTKVSNNSVPDPIALLTQKIDQMNTQFVQVQNQLMNRMTTVERNQSAPRPQFSRQQRDATGWKPRPQQEAKAPDTLKPVGTVDIEAWCLPCQEPHREDECPRRDEDYPDDINFMICNFNDEQVTQEQINEARRIGEREGRLWALNKLTDDQKKELRRREILTYTRRKNASAPPSQPDTPLPSAEKVAPPPPPPVCELLPKPTPTDDIQLNIDVASMFGKLNMTVPVTECVRSLL
jgi:hypothetical protein